MTALLSVGQVHQKSEMMMQTNVSPYDHLLIIVMTEGGMCKKRQPVEGPSKLFLAPIIAACSLLAQLAMQLVALIVD